MTLAHIFLYLLFLVHQERIVRILQKQLRSSSAPGWSGDSLHGVTHAGMDGEALQGLPCPPSPPASHVGVVGCRKSWDMSLRRKRVSYSPSPWDPLSTSFLFGDQLYLLTPQDEGVGGWEVGAPSL